MQETSFPVEVVIHDDASTDETPIILEEYRNRYPNVIRVISQSVNQRSQGRKILQLVFPEIRGEFLAVCEGDDYWSNPRKLQIQYDFLISRPDAQLCFHDCSIISREGDRWTVLHNNNWASDEVTTFDLLDGNPAITCSAFMRRDGFPIAPSFFEQFKMGDLPLWLLYSLKGKILWIHSNMGVYRFHEGGSWSNKPQSEMHLGILECILGIEHNLPLEYSESHRAAVARHMARYLVHHDQETRDLNAEVPCMGLRLGPTEVGYFVTEYAERASWVLKENPGEAQTFLIAHVLRFFGGTESEASTLVRMSLSHHLSQTNSTEYNVGSSVNEIRKRSFFFERLVYFAFLLRRIKKWATR
jgi:glycosyltransferase involved in cell wall biosynthesis